MKSILLALRSLQRSIRERAARAWNCSYDPWRRFWFEPADPTPLAVMRILFGGMLLYTHIVWGLNLEGFLGPHGWQGDTLVRTLQSEQLAWSFWWWTPHGLYLTLHILCLAILTLFMLGAFTPVTSVLAYLITISYSSRAPMANYGLDQINGMAALYLAIGPSGCTLSIDRLRQRLRVARDQISQGVELVIPPVPRSPRANLALRLMQVHLCVIYVFACLSKLQGESWWNGTAIWQAVSNLEYQSRDITWLAWYPWLVNLLTHATIVWEMTFWALVWRPVLRPYVLLMGTAIHLGIGAFMGMWTFGLAVIFAYVSFLPGEQLSAIVGRLADLVAWSLARLGLQADATSDRRARIAWFALGLEDCGARATNPPAVTAEAQSDVDPSVSPIGTATEVSTANASGQEAANETAARTVAPVQAQEIDSEPSPIPSVASGGRRERLPSRPSILLIEGRLKRQAEVQEYFLKHGFRCHVASDLHQARSMLSVMDFDALVVTASWFPHDELSAFHDGLVGGGAALPASVFLLGSAATQADHRFSETPRHRILAGGLSLRQLRLLVLEVLGLTEESLRRFKPESRHGKNGRQTPTAVDRSLEIVATAQNTVDLSSNTGEASEPDGNGSLP
jgi:hypothetical protein